MVRRIVEAQTDHSDMHSEAGSQQSMDEFKHQNESKPAGGDIGQNLPADAEILIGFGDADYEERLSDISDGGLSVGTETDGMVESISSSEGTKSAEKPGKAKPGSRVPRVAQKLGQTAPTQQSTAKELLKVSSSLRKTTPGSSSSKLSKRWQ